MPRIRRPDVEWRCDLSVPVPRVRQRRVARLAAAGDQPPHHLAGAHGTEYGAGSSATGLLPRRGASCVEDNSLLRNGKVRVEEEPHPIAHLMGTRVVDSKVIRTYHIYN